METFAHGVALLIGVDENAVPAWALPTVAQDVAALQAVLTHPERCGYAPERVRVLTGPAATRQGILDGLEWLREELQADAAATALVYYSGHGWRDTAAAPPDYYLLPYDMKETSLKSRALRAVEFADAIGELAPRHLLVILDCCHAGGMGVKGAATPAGYAPAALPAAAFLAGGAGAKGIDPLAQGRAVLSASTGEQQSWLRRDGKMSVFTYHLIEALTGHAQPQAGAREVLVSDVMSYVTRRVPVSARVEAKAEQTPHFELSGASFAVALLLGGKGIAPGQGAPPVESTGAAPSDPPARAGSDQRGQVVHGLQTNIAGNVTGPVLSGRFDGPVSVGSGDAIDARHSQGAVIKPTGPVTQREIRTGGGDYYGEVDVKGDFVRGNQTKVVGNGNIVGDGATVTHGVSADAVAALFERALELARTKPAAVRDAVEAAVTTAQEETAAGEEADKRLLSKMLDLLLDKAPDVLEIVIEAILNPAAAAGKGARMLASQIRDTLHKQRKP